MKEKSTKKQAQISGEELLVINQTPVDAKGRSQKLRVVRWVVDGKKQSPKLEKRGFYPGKKTGAIMTGDLEPLQLGDLQKLSEKLPTVLAVMQAAA